MKAVMVMFDSLNRHFLPNYGCDWTIAPNFRRLAERTLTFDTSYVCSMPCMPARRDLLTGRPNFLHRSWGPLEPFDDSMPKLLRHAGTPAHFVSDHYHYWEAGGATYHCQYSTWQFFRGQEGDPWMGQIAPPPRPEHVVGRGQDNEVTRQDWTNRQFMRTEADLPITRTFNAGLDFLKRNEGEDNFFLQIETFDPHEPFYSLRQHKDRYPHDYEGGHFDWPSYRFVEETPEEVEHIRYEYASLLSLCDQKLGDVLDLFDAQNLWDDTMLIVWTDHGFMLGEHNCWAKIWQPFYEEIAHTPFFLWDPRHGQCGERRAALVQPAIDLAPTLLGLFGQAPAPNMLGKDLEPVVINDTAVREAAIFGVHGGHVNVTDGQYVYMRAPADESNQPLHNYTLMPTDMRTLWAPERFRGAALAEPFAFTKECPTLKCRAGGKWGKAPEHGTHLWDVSEDPAQTQPLDDPDTEQRLIRQMVELMRECDAPAEQFERLGIG